MHHNITAKKAVRVRMAVARGAHVGIGLRGVCLPEVRKHVNSRRDNSPAQSRTVAYTTDFNFLDYNYIIHLY